MTRPGPAHWRRMGRAFGYPECCVDDFVARMLTDDKGPRNRTFCGTGYIPCPACDAEARMDPAAFVRRRIAPRRVVAVPFPHCRPASQQEVNALLASVAIRDEEISAN